MDKFITDAVKEINISSKALNFFSPRSSSFINPVLLDFPNRNVKMPQGNS